MVTSCSTFVRLITVKFTATTRDSEPRAWNKGVNHVIGRWARLVVNRQNDFPLACQCKLKNYGDLPLHVRIRLPVEVTSYMTALLRQHVSRFLYIHVPEHEDADEVVSSINEGQPAPLVERLSWSVKRKLLQFTLSFAALENTSYPSPQLTPQSPIEFASRHHNTSPAHHHLPHDWLSTTSI